MAFHEIHRLRSIRETGERSLNRTNLAVTGGFDHPGIGIGGAHAGDVTIDERTPATGDGFPLDQNHAGAFAHDEAVSMPVKRPGHLLRWTVGVCDSRQSPQDGKIQKMQRRERFFPASHQRRVQQAAAHHLNGTVQRHQ